MRFPKTTAMLGFMLFLMGCGLPDSYFLQPPTPVKQAAGLSGDPFSFSNPDHTNDFGVSFTGFELYYRFYNQGDAVNINAYDPTNPADPVTQLLNAGFLPVRSATDTQSSQSIPLINVQALVSSGVLASTNATFTVQVNITGSQTTPPPGPGTYILGGNPAVEIRRGVLDLATGYGFKNFLSNLYPPLSGAPPPNYSAADADFSRITTPSSVWVALYVLSYGVITLSTPTRSTPVYLGYSLVNLTGP